MCAGFGLWTESRFQLVTLADNRGAVLFLLELDVGVFHLHDWEHLLHLVD
jgi:hypothetical protein